MRIQLLMVACSLCLARAGLAQETAIPAAQPFGMRMRAPAASMAEVHAPTVVAPSPQNEAQIVSFPDGTLRIYYVQRPEGTSIRSIGSSDGGLTWTGDRHEFDLPGVAYYAVRIIEDAGELHAVYHIFRGEGRKLGVDRNLDLWHCKTNGGFTSWGPSQRIFVGYVGSLRGGIRIKSGRLVVPFAIAIPERGSPPPAGEPDYGLHNIITLTSDDRGTTWQRSPDELKVTLCGENTTRYGAVEPNVIELADGRVWMLIRDRCGHLYESYSPDGARWSEPQQSRFISSDSPATTVRLADNRIVVFFVADQRWDNPRSYAMGGREVLHAAITADEGRTWQGFREVLTEPLPPAVRGDRGTAYPSAVCNTDGKIVLCSGQGHGRQAIVLFDPDWLTETESADDFSGELVEWTHYGASGVRVIPDAERAGRKVMAIQRDNAEQPAGALWNFPAGFAGTFRIRLRVPANDKGCELWLTDHFSMIDDKEAPAHAMYRLTAAPAGVADATVSLEPDRWHELTIEWPADGGPARASLDDGQALALPRQSATATGINYFGIRSLDDSVVEAALLIESVGVRVDPALARTASTGGKGTLQRSAPTLNIEKVRGPAARGAVLDLGARGAFDEKWMSCPAVVQRGDQYLMWYSSYYDTKSGPGGIGLAVSRDGIHWTRANDGRPVLELPTAGPLGNPVFDGGQVMGPSVLHDGQKWLMWYTGMSVPRHESGFGFYRIGLATSADGIDWTREANGSPVLDVGPTAACDAVQAATPTVLREGDGYRMWYAAWSPECNHTIASADSSDGVHWTKERDGQPVSGLDPSIAFGHTVARVGDQYLLLYMALRSDPGIYAAVSSDGRGWKMINAGRPILGSGNADDFDAHLVGHPSLLVEEDRVRIWYTGYRRAPGSAEGLELSIGLAEGTWH